MDKERYATLIALKTALDSEYKRRNTMSIVQQDYDKTLGKAKIAGFKVYRNSAGEHKLVDNVKNKELAKVYEMMAGAI